MKLTDSQLYVYNKIIQITMIKLNLQKDEAYEYIGTIIKKLNKTNPNLTWSERINIVTNEILNANKHKDSFIIEI